MAFRPAYFIQNEKIMCRNFEFEWFGGFALSQKQKCITAFHHSIKTANNSAIPLEISTKGSDKLGVKLSAFNLKLNGYPFENVFQSSKVFEHGGAYSDLLTVSPKEAKRDERLKNSGKLIGFHYDGQDFPLEPKTVFYDYIYLCAVRETLTQDEIQQIRNYTHFTDIEFNPQKSINTQAKAVAILKRMLELYETIPEMTTEEFISFHRKYVFA